MATPRLSFSLRGHSLQVSCCLFFDNFLVSADSEGYVFWWDLNLKRPKWSWRAHDSHILLLDYVEKFNVLLTHSRDSSIRFWDLSNKGETNCPPFKELPVNSLNFCNVSLISSRYLLTPSTVDSDNFDVYDINLATTSESLDFTRLMHNVSPWDLYIKSLKTLPVPLDDDLSKRDKFGIMMRTLWVDESTFYVAYESGHILGFSMEHPSSKLSNMEKGNTKSTSLLNKGPIVRVFHISEELKPNPVISLIRRGNSVIAGSASKLIQILDIPSSRATLTEDSTDLILLKYSGLSQISLLQPNIIVVGFWNGIVKGFSANQELDEVFKIEKSLPMIDTNDENQTQRLKISSISCKGSLNKDTSVISGKSQKDLLRSRRDVSNKILMAVGYESGLINTYEF